MASKRFTHSDELLENLGEGKIPITIVTRFLDHKPEIKPKDSIEKVRTVQTEADSTEPKKVGVVQATATDVIATENKVDSTSKTVMPYSKNGSLRNEWTRRKSQRPKTNRENVHFKETYEKLKR